MEDDALASFQRKNPLKVVIDISTYPRSECCFPRALIGICQMLYTFDAWMRGKMAYGGRNVWIRKFLFCQLFWQLAWNNIQLSPEGEVNSGRYIPRREASRYISTTIHYSRYISTRRRFTIRGIYLREASRYISTTSIEVIFQNRVRVFHRGFQTREN